MRMNKEYQTISVSKTLQEPVKKNQPCEGIGLAIQTGTRAGWEWQWPDWMSPNNTEAKPATEAGQTKV